MIKAQNERRAALSPISLWPRLIILKRGGKIYLYPKITISTIITSYITTQNGKGRPRGSKKYQVIPLTVGFIAFVDHNARVEKTL
jgi:hypothetical protein